MSGGYPDACVNTLLTSITGTDIDTDADVDADRDRARDRALH